MAHIIRRVRQAGVYFVSSRTWQSRALFQKPEIARVLIEQLLDCRDRGFHKLHAFVVMPDHFHALLAPAGSVSVEKTMQMIKGGSAHTIKRTLNYASPVWQPGFHDRWIRDAAEYKSRMDYILTNPIAAKLVTRPDEYLFGSFCGRYQLDPSQFDIEGAGVREPA